MNFAETFLPELDHEVANTRKILELVPDSLHGWQASESLNTVGWVASHLADTFSWVEVLVRETSFDVAPPDGPAHETPILESTAKIVASFDTNVASARELISNIDADELMVPWTLKLGGKDLNTMPRVAWLKSLLINHIVHHRAFLICYLRMNGVECPQMYG